MAKKVILIVLGVLIGLIGLIGLVGAAGLLIASNNGILQTGFHSLATNTTAFESPTTDINTYSIGTPSLRVQANSANGVFVGIGPAGQVNQYLAGSPVTTITSLDLWPYSITSSNRGGSSTPAPPDQQSFWVAKGSGATSASLSWKLASGQYKLVIMRSDGAPHVVVQARVGVKIPYLVTWAIVGLVVALLLLALGVLLFVLGIRTRPPQLAGPWPDTPPGGVPPTSDPAGAPGTFPAAPSPPPPHPTPPPPPPASPAGPTEPEH